MTGCVHHGGGRLVSAVERDDAMRLQQLLVSLDEHYHKHAGGISQLAKCLYISAARGRLECARLLLDAGAQPNIRGDTNGQTPLVRNQRLSSLKQWLHLK